MIDERDVLLPLLAELGNDVLSLESDLCMCHKRLVRISNALLLLERRLNG